MKNIVYRIKQFTNALLSKPSMEDLNWVEEVLGGPLYELFQNLQDSEQSHAIKVGKTLLSAGEDAPELLQAALLHDIGKIKYPMILGERVLIVLVKKLFPNFFIKRAKGKAAGFFRALVIAEKHAEWGALLARDQGAAEKVVVLIAAHENALDPLAPYADSIIKLKQADNRN